MLSTDLANAERKAVSISSRLASGATSLSHPRPCRPAFAAFDPEVDMDAFTRRCSVIRF
jgi:hypothetical protein